MPDGPLSLEQIPLLQMAFGALTAQILYVAAKLAIADRLRDGHLTAAELAGTLGVDALTLERVLRALVSLGVCNESAGGRFRLTPLGDYLRADHPDSVQPRVLFNGEVLYPLWGDLLETATSGEAASRRIYGMPFYDYLVSKPAVGSLFDRTLAASARYRHRPTADAYDFGRFKTIVDVGGGNGGLMVEILNTYPRPTGIVFDLPRAAEGAARNIEAARLADRCRFVGGDAFEAVPGGADAYLLSNFLISWGDDRAVMPLRSCRKAMVGGGTLLLVEWVMPAAGEPQEDFRFWDAVSMDLNMLAVFGSGSGYVRTRSAFQELLAAARFTLTAVVPTRSPVSVLEAAPA